MRNLLLVARREYLAYVSAWGFWLGLLLTPLILGISVGLPMIVEQTTPTRYYAVIDQNGTFETALEDAFESDREGVALGLIESHGITAGEAAADAATARFETARENGVRVEAALEQALPDSMLRLPKSDFAKVDAPARTIEALTPYLTGDAEIDGPDGTRPLFAVFIVRDDQEVEYWSEDVVSSSLSRQARDATRLLARNQALETAGVPLNLLTIAERDAMTVSERSPAGTGDAGKVSLADRAPFFVSLALSFGLWLLIFSVVNFLLTGTIEERSNKIFDTLLTRISIPQLLAGKLLGILGLSLTLVGSWTVISVLLGLRFASDIPPEIMQGMSAVSDPALLVPAFISFVLGYLMYGSVFLALGSLCDTIQEAQSLMSPVFIVLMVPLFLLPIALNNPSSAAIEWLSWVPLLTPFLLIVRIPGDPALWTILGQLLLMAGFTALTIWAAARVYRAGAVHSAGIGDIKRLIPFIGR